MAYQCRHYPIAIGKLHILRAIDIDRLILAQWRFLYLSIGTKGDQIAILIIGLNGQNGHHFLVSSKPKQITRWFPFCRALPLRNTMDSDLADMASGTDAEQVIL